MKRSIPLIVIVLLASTVAWWVSTKLRHPTEELVSGSGQAHQCPMHPWVKSELPGKCNVCGMNLTAASKGSTAIDSVMLPPGSPGVIGVRTVEVKKQPLVRTLRVAGMIGEDESRHGIISAPVEGRIDGLAMNHDGQPITRRQPLATIFSRTLLKAAEEYNLALKQSPEAAEAAKRRLEQYGLVWEQIKAIPQRQPDDLYFGILAPLSGVIVKSYVAEGQYVKEGEKLFEIADFTKMWFMFPASEQDLPLLKVGQIATLRTPSLPGQTLKARVSFISPNLNEMTRTASVRVVLENQDRRIKNKTYADGFIEIEAPELIAIPRSAVLWPGNVPRVFVEEAAGVYQPREVQLGRAGDELWEVLDGLKEGERVVSKGGMLIDSQAQLDALAVSGEPAADPTITDPTLSLDYLKAVAAVSAALARDDLAAANAAVKQLPPAPEGVVKAAVPVSSPDLKSLRQAFLPWSQEVAALAMKARAKAPELHVFRCPMTKELWPGAPANAAWVQFGGELKNPYWGKDMLDCGIEVKP